MKKAIYYLTFNGIFNDTNGIATQTRNVIDMVEKYRDNLQSEIGEFDFYIVCPKPDSNYWGYSKEYFDKIKKRLNNANIKLHLCALDNDIEFWDVRNWKILCKKAAEFINRTSTDYINNLVIAIDTPYIQVAKYIYARPNINTVLVLYGGAYVLDANIDTVRLKWEQDGLDIAKKNPHVKIADVGIGMTNILIEKYRCKKSDFVPFKTSISINQEDKDFNKCLSKYNIPKDIPIIFSFGRADAMKGFEDVINATAKFKDSSRLVLLAPGTDDNENIRLYKELKDKYYPDMILISEFDRELPKSIVKNCNTVMVICPSHKECFSNIPLEVSAWTKDTGTILLCRDIDSYSEVIKDSYNGFLFSDYDDLQSKIGKILGMSRDERLKISKSAYDIVLKDYDIVDQFKKLLKSLSF
jgi:glycosyltransferase involved in cell wall biosynthesis